MLIEPVTNRYPTTCVLGQRYASEHSPSRTFAVTRRRFMTFRSWRAKSLPVVIGLGAIVAAACGSTSTATTGPAVTKTTATFAEGQGAQPNYIFPLASLAYFSVANLSPFQFLMHRPLD